MFRGALLVLALLAGAMCGVLYARRPVADAAGSAHRLLRDFETYTHFLETLGEPLDPVGCHRFWTGSTVYRAIYEPSAMGASCVLSLRESAGEWIVTVRWLDRNGDDGALPVPSSAGAAVPQEVMEAFESEMRDVRPMDLQDDDRLGQDGTLLFGDVCAGFRRRDFSVWSPDDRHPRHRQYFAALGRVGLSSLTDPEALEVLSGALGQHYEDSGLLLQDLGGTPRVIRLTGKMLTSDLWALDRYFSTIPAGETVLLDGMAMRGIPIPEQWTPVARTIFRRFMMHHRAVLSVPPQLMNDLRGGPLMEDRFLASSVAGARARLVARGE